MKTNAYFYVNDKNETRITTLYDIDANSFKIGDRFWFSVSMLFPVTLINMGKEFDSKFLKAFKEQHSKQAQEVGNTRFQIISKYTELVYDANYREDDKQHTLRIEYKCRAVKPIYWKFWKTYKFKESG